MKNLQEIINNKARKRAEDEVKVLLEAFRKGDLIDLLGAASGVKVDINGKITDLRDAFWGINDRIPKMLIEKLTEKFIPEESEAFVRRVEELESDVEHLLGQ